MDKLYILTRLAMMKAYCSSIEDYLIRTPAEKKIFKRIVRVIVEARKAGLSEQDIFEALPSLENNKGAGHQGEQNNG